MERKSSNDIVWGPWSQLYLIQVHFGVFLSLYICPSNYLPTYLSFFFFSWTSLSWLFFSHSQKFRDVSPSVLSMKSKPFSRSKKQKSKPKTNKWATNGNDTVWVEAIHSKISRLFSGIWPRDLSPEPGEAFLALSSRQGCGQALGRAGGQEGVPSGQRLKRSLGCHGEEQVLGRWFVTAGWGSHSPPAACREFLVTFRQLPPKRHQSVFSGGAKSSTSMSNKVNHIWNCLSWNHDSAL